MHLILSVALSATLICSSPLTFSFSSLAVVAFIPPCNSLSSPSHWIFFLMHLISPLALSAPFNFSPQPFFPFGSLRNPVVPLHIFFKKKTSYILFFTLGTICNCTSSFDLLLFPSRLCPLFSPVILYFPASHLLFIMHFIFSLSMICTFYFTP